MSRVSDLLGAFRDFTEPRDGVGNSPFRLACTLDEPATESQILTAWDDQPVPTDLVDLWRTCREARLFEDVDYGQWGLRLLSPEASAQRTRTERAARPADVGPEDVVFAEFLGDQELLVRTAGEDGVLIALPLDPRSDWYTGGPDIEAFLERYLASHGEKYWEAAP